MLWSITRAEIALLDCISGIRVKLMPSRRSSELLLGAMLLASLFLLGGYFFFDSSDQAILWLSVIVSSISLCAILAGEGPHETKLVALLLFASAYHVAPLLRGGGAGIPSRLVFTRDEAYQAQLDSLIFESGSWHPGIGLGPAFWYSFYPCLAILHVVAMNVIGPNTGTWYFVNLAFPALTAILPLVFYTASMNKMLLNEEWALWSGFIFALNEQFLFFDSSFSYESLAIVFFTGIFYLLTRRFGGAVKSLIFLMAVVITASHFWTDLNLLLFLAVFLVAPFLLRPFSRNARSNLSNSTVPPRSLTYFLIALSSFAAYSAFVATTVAGRHVGEALLGLSQFIALGPSIVPNLSYRSGSEVFLIVLGQAILVAFGLHGLFTRRSGPSRFLKSLFLFGGIYLVMMLFALPSSLARPIIHRGFFFGFFALAPVVAWTIAHSRSISRRELKAMLLVLVLVSVVLMQEPWFRYPDFVAPESQLYSGIWASGHTPFASPILSMASVEDVFGTYGRMRDLGVGPYYGESRLIVVSFLQQNVSELLKPYDGHYLAVSSSTNEWLLRYFVEQELPAVRGQVYLGTVMNQLSEGPSFNRIFESGYVILYYVNY